MKKILTIILSVVFLTVCWALTACQEHQHVFDKKVIATEYQKNQADCLNAATYYYSCSCGEKGDAIFTYGLKLDHSFSEDNVCDVCENSYSDVLEFNLINDDTGYQVQVGEILSCERVIIPSEYQGKPVTDIKFTTSSYNSPIKTIDIPSSIEDIGKKLAGMRKLEMVYFCQNSKLKVIDEKAFYNCYNLKEICLPKSIESIGKYAFSNCVDLESLTFEEDCQVKTIGDCAFSYLHMLKSIELPGAVQEIGQSIFSGCSALKEIKFGGTMEKWLSFDYNSWEIGLGGGSKMTTVPVKVIQCANGKIYLKK